MEQKEGFLRSEEADEGKSRLTHIVQLLFCGRGSCADKNGLGLAVKDMDIKLRRTLHDGIA